MHQQWLRPFRVMLAHGFRAAPWQAMLLFLLCAVSVGAGLASIVGVKLLVDAVILQSLRDSVIAIVVLVGSVAIMDLANRGTLELTVMVIEKASATIDRHLMALTTGIAGLAHFELPEFLRELELLRADRPVFGHMVNATYRLFRAVIQLAGTSLVLARLDPVLILLPGLGVASFLAIKRTHALEQAAREATAEDSRCKDHLYGLATSAAAGKELRIFHTGQELLTCGHDTAWQQVVGTQTRALWKGLAYKLLGSLLFIVGYVGSIVLVLGHAVRGDATPGDVLLVITIAAQTNSLITAVVSDSSYVLRAVKSARRYLWLVDHAEATRLDVPDHAPIPSQLHQGIAFENVSFHYPGTEKPVLRDISLALPAGGVVALVGENGAGKTTLVKLLCRFYEPVGGRILGDGADLRCFEVDAWRERVSAAYQDFSRFEFLARETVGVGHLPQIEDAPTVQAALRRAGGHDGLTTLPAGLETQLGRAWEDGIDLSGGQWQKLALGRALMRTTPLLVVLDEPTASLDAMTEHELFERFTATARAGESQGTVTLLVSHRFSTVRMADHIVVLDNGRILEQGSHDELMRNEQLYAELYRLQSRAYR